MRETPSILKLDSPLSLTLSLYFKYSLYYYYYYNEHVREGDRVYMSQKVEASGEGEAHEVEDSTGRRGGSQSSLDEYLPGSDSDEEALGVEEQDDEGHLRGVGSGEVHRPGEGRQDQDDEMGIHRGGCRLLDREDGKYPCFHCSGGRDFSECQRMRGVT